MNEPVLSLRSVLVLGGARSGKSRYAQALAESSGRHAVLIATATAFDDEMRARIALHRAERGAGWRTVEAPTDLGGALASATGPDRVTVVDCLTLWLSNLLLAGHEPAAATATLAAAVAGLAGPVIFVSNEVGSGIVPENALARAFRDAQGRLNQAMARACAGVVLVSAGLPHMLKPSSQPRLRLDTD